MKISVQGAIDLHFHSHPCLVPSIGDDLDVAAHAKLAGLKALVLWCDHESTVSRAYLLRKLVADIEIFGGIVLNWYVGGFNPAAVEAALKLGGKVVAMPTLDAAHHREVFGRSGSPGLSPARPSDGDGLQVVDEAGKIPAELIEILELVANYDAVLATSHISPQEVRAVVREARNRGVQKILVSHPLFKAPRLDLESLQGLVRLGAVAEFTYRTVSPQWAHATQAETKHAIETLGPANCVLSSDTGQVHNPMPAEALRIFAQGLCELGIAEDDIYRMMCNNPAALLGVGGSLQHQETVRPFPTSAIAASQQ